MASAQYCASCGAAFNEAERFCRDCGTQRPNIGPGPGAAGSASAGAQAWGDQFDRAPAGPWTTAVESSQLASLGRRTGSWLLNGIVPGVLGVIPFLGIVVNISWAIWMLVLYRRGQDVGAKLLGLRVVRDTGELAGFFHMWSRNLAAFLSFIAIGAGYWTALFDPHRQTWHDKIMGTYVVDDRPELEKLPGTSSAGAVVWFWISLLVVVGLVVAAISVAAAAVSGFGGL